MINNVCSLNTLGLRDALYVTNVCSLNTPGLRDVLYVTYNVCSLNTPGLRDALYVTNNVFSRNTPGPRDAMSWYGGKWHEIYHVRHRSMLYTVFIKQIKCPEAFSQQILSEIWTWISNYTSVRNVITQFSSMLLLQSMNFDEFVILNMKSSCFD